MEFSAILQRCSSLSRWSPDGELLAAVYDNIFHLRRIEDPTGGRLFVTQHKIQQLCWAPNSQKLFVRFSNHLCVYSIEDPSRGFTIEEEMQPIVAGIWSPDSSFILTAPECNLRLSVWALSDEGYADETFRKLLVRRPKYPLSSGQAFSASKDLWAVCTRTELKDFLEIFSTQSWHLYKSFSVRTQNLENFIWMPSGTSLLLWDSPLYANLLVYHISGDLLQCMQFSSLSLGIQGVSLHARSQTLLVQFFDQSIRVISAFDFEEVHQRPLTHKKKINAQKRLLILEEKNEERMQEQPSQQEATKSQNNHQQDFLQKQQKAVQAITTCGDNKKQEGGSSTVLRMKEITNTRESTVKTSYGACETSDLATSTCYVPVDFSGNLDKPSVDRKKSTTGCSTSIKTRLKANNSSTEDSSSSSSEADQKTEQLLPKSLYLPYRKKKTATVGTGMGTASLESENQRSAKRGFLQSKLPLYLREKKSKIQSQALRLRVSPCGTFLATNCASFPTVVFLWNLHEGELRYILLHQQPVSGFTWNPHPAAFSDGSCLTICTNENKVFFWTPLWQSVLQLPFQTAEFRCQNLRWSSRGEALLLQDKGKALIAYPSFLYMPASIEKETY